MSATESGNLKKKNGLDLGINSNVSVLVMDRLEILGEEWQKWYRHYLDRQRITKGDLILFGHRLYQAKANGMSPEYLEPFEEDFDTAFFRYKVAEQELQSATNHLMKGRTINERPPQEVA